MLQCVFDSKEYLHTIYEITRNSGMWGAIAGGCLTKQRQITVSKLQENEIDIKEMQIKDIQKVKELKDFRFLLDTSFVKPKVDLSLDKKSVILYENCFKIGKETIVSKGSDPCRIKLINLSEGLTDFE